MSNLGGPFSLSCLACVCCCCVIPSIVYALEILRLNNLQQCAEIELVKCPLNQQLFDEQGRKYLTTLWSNNAFDIRYLFNPYYYSDSIDMTVSFICTPILSSCSNGSQRITLTPDVFYIGIDKLNANYIYVSKALLENMSSRLYGTPSTPSPSTPSPSTPSPSTPGMPATTPVDSFLAQVQIEDSKFDKSKYNKISMGDRNNYNDTCLFFSSPYDTIIPALVNSLYRNMDINLALDLFKKLEKKYNSKTMTTFEFFSYCALQSLQYKREKNIDVSYQFINEADT